MDHRVRAKPVAVCIVGDVAPEADPASLLAFVGQVGADGVDLRTGLSLPQSVTAENAGRWRRLLEASSLSAPILAAQLELGEKPLARDAVVALAGLADELEVTAVRLLPMSRDTDVLAARVAELRQIAPHMAWMVETTGAWAGATVGMESIWRDEAPVWLWDMAHTLAVGETPAETLDRLGLPHHVHVGHFDTAPIGRRVLPPEMVREAVQELLARGYSGALSGEWLGWPESRREREVRSAVAALRAFLAPSGDGSST